MHNTSTIINSIFTHLEDRDEVCFLNYGEFGWEISILSPIVKLFKKTFPEKKVFIATRDNRKELYTGSNLDDYFYFNIPGDYKTVTPRTNSIKVTPVNTSSRPDDLNTEKIFTNLKETVKSKYPNVYFYTFEDLPFIPNPDFNFSEFDYNFKPDPINAEIIDNIIKNNGLNEIVTLFPRHRVDLSHRNWTETNWKELFKKLNNETNFLCFVSGSSPSYVKPLKKYKNLIILEDLIANYPKASILGLTIEAIKRSNFTFGPQTAGILLSNLLKTPTIYFGKEELLVSENYNPYKNLYHFINVKYNDKLGYTVSVNQLFESIVDYKNRINNLTSFNKTEFIVENKEPTFRFPKMHPMLIGLEGEEYNETLKRINLNPQQYSSNILRETKIVKKLIK